MLNKIDKILANTWWDSLSINEMKEFTKKYYPEFAWYSLPPSFIIDIWKREVKKAYL